MWNVVVVFFSFWFGWFICALLSRDGFEMEELLWLLRRYIRQQRYPEALNLIEEWYCSSKVRCPSRGISGEPSIDNNLSKSEGVFQDDNTHT